MAKTATITYVIQTECGQMEIAATSIAKAKQVYAEEHGYNFDATRSIEGSWYYIGNFETGEKLEAMEACRPAK
jgi:hypothetical protein